MARTVPSIPLQNPGNLLASSVWNTGPKATTDFFMSPPVFRGYQTATFSMTTGVRYAMAINSVQLDTDSGHATNSATYTAQVGGWYWVNGYVAWTSITTQCLIIGQIYVNGSPVPGIQQWILCNANDFGGVSAAGLVQLNAGDGVEMVGEQNSGIARSTYQGAELASSLNVVWVHA